LYQVRRKDRVSRTLKWPLYLRDYCNGKTQKEIAAQYGVREDSVRRTFAAARVRYRARNMGELVKKVIREGKWEL
jgi:hypothetical protein